MIRFYPILFSFFLITSTNSYFILLILNFWWTIYLSAFFVFLPINELLLNTRFLHVLALFFIFFNRCLWKLTIWSFQQHTWLSSDPPTSSSVSSSSSGTLFVWESWESPSYDPNVWFSRRRRLLLIWLV